MTKWKRRQSGACWKRRSTGTAAVISPIGELKVDDRNIVINDNKIGEVARRLYDTLTGIQTCRIDDPFGWVVKID